MTTVVSTGYGKAVGNFVLQPEFPVTEQLVRGAELSPIEAGMSQRRQYALSANEVDFNDQVREWTLVWENATTQEAADLRQYYAVAAGNAGLLLYLPPNTTGASNLAPSGEDFVTPVWRRGTDDTTVDVDGTALPSGVGGSAYLLRNAGGATEPAYLYARSGRYPAAGYGFAWSVYIQRPSSNPSGYATVRVRNPGTGDTDFATFAWNGSAWAFDVGSNDGVPQTVVSGSWTRILYFSVSNITGVSSYPAKRYLEIETGKTGAVEAGKDLLIAGAVLEEVREVADLSGIGSYNAKRRHVLVRIMDSPLQIERVSANRYRMQVTLREVPVAP